VSRSWRPWSAPLLLVYQQRKPSDAGAHPGPAAPRARDGARRLPPAGWAGHRLSDQTRRTYASKVRGYLAWLAAADVEGDPLTEPDRPQLGRGGGYRTRQAAVLKRANAAVNDALPPSTTSTSRSGLAAARRLDLSALAPRASQ
jgi:hypothetical protein